jgi:hypothetical protein
MRCLPSVRSLQVQNTGVPSRHLLVRPVASTVILPVSVIRNRPRSGTAPKALVIFIPLSPTVLALTSALASSPIEPFLVCTSQLIPGYDRLSHLSELHGSSIRIQSVI